MSSNSNNNNDSSNSKRLRAGSISGRLRAVSDLEESGFIDKKQKGILKDLIISGDHNFQAALDKFEQGDPSEIQALIQRGILSRKQSVDLLDGLDFEFLNVQKENNGGLFEDLFDTHFSRDKGKNDNKSDIISSKISPETPDDPTPTKGSVSWSRDVSSRTHSLGGLAGLGRMRNDSLGGILSSGLHGSMDQSASGLGGFRLFDLPGVPFSEGDDLLLQCGSLTNVFDGQGRERGSSLVTGSFGGSGRDIDSLLYSGGGLGLGEEVDLSAYQMMAASLQSKGSSSSSGRSTSDSSSHRSSSSPPTTFNTNKHNLGMPTSGSGAAGGRGYVGAYTPEQRLKRIEKFREKRLKRVWTKKVKYDVRKNFADSRLRVKGRFVKKEEENIMRELLHVGDDDLSSPSSPLVLGLSEGGGLGGVMGMGGLGGMGSGLGGVLDGGSGLLGGMMGMGVMNMGGMGGMGMGGLGGMGMMGMGGLGMGGMGSNLNSDLLDGHGDGSGLGGMGGGLGMGMGMGGMGFGIPIGLGSGNSSLNSTILGSGLGMGGLSSSVDTSPL